MRQEKELYYCIWYKPEYAHTSEYTDAIVVNAVSPEQAKDFCKAMITDAGGDWTEYNIYGTFYNENNKMMKKVFEEQEGVAWEAE